MNRMVRTRCLNAHVVRDAGAVGGRDSAKKTPAKVDPGISSAYRVQFLTCLNCASASERVWSRRVPSS